MDLFNCPLMGSAPRLPPVFQILLKALGRKGKVGHVVALGLVCRSMDWVVRIWALALVIHVTCMYMYLWWERLFTLKVLLSKVMKYKWLLASFWGNPIKSAGGGGSNTCSCTCRCFMLQKPVHSEVLAGEFSCLIVLKLYIIFWLKYSMWYTCYFNLFESHFFNLTKYSGFNFLLQDCTNQKRGTWCRVWFYT